MNTIKKLKTAAVILGTTFGCAAVNVLAFDTSIQMYNSGHLVLFCLVVIADACLCLLLLMAGIFMLGKVFGIRRFKG